MKLALVISSLDYGGAERVMTLLANGWAERGITLILITLDSAKTDFYALHPAVKRIGLGLVKDSGNPIAALISNWRRTRALRKAFRENQPDAIISFLTTTNILTALACQGLKIPILLAERISPSSESPRGIWRALRYLIYARAQLVVQTEQGARWFRQRFPHSHVRVIPNPVVIAADDDARDTTTYTLLKSLSHVPFIIGIGRLVPQKGFDLLLRAFASIHSRYSEWSLVILGEGPEQKMLTHLAQELGIGNCVYMPGHVTEAHAVLRRAALFALSSRYEGMPNVLLEAMAYGLPCLSFDCPTGPRELIQNNTNGILVPPNDVDGFANAMEKLMESCKERQRLGIAAADVADRYSLATVLAQWDAALADITGLASRRASDSQDYLKPSCAD